MLAPHLTRNVLVGGDRSSLPVGTHGKDGGADAEDADVRDGRVALPRGGGCPPAAVGRPDLYFCESVIESEGVRNGRNHDKEKEIERPTLFAARRNNEKDQALLDIHSSASDSNITHNPLSIFLRLL